MKSFYCSELQVNVVKPCAAQTCSFNVTNPHSLNCSMFHTNNAGITLAEISSFYRRPTNEVEALFNKAQRKINTRVLAQWVEEETHIPVYYIKTKKVCLVCESLLTHTAYKKLQGKYVVCSKECYEMYPERMWKWATSLNADPKTVLEVTFSRLRTVAAISKFLGMSTQTIKELGAKYGVLPTKYAANG